MFDNKGNSSFSHFIDKKAFLRYFLLSMFFSYFHSQNQVNKKSINYL